jgi:hypothetical protein
MAEKLIALLLVGALLIFVGLLANHSIEADTEVVVDQIEEVIGTDEPLFFADTPGGLAGVIVQWVPDHSFREIDLLEPSFSSREVLLVTLEVTCTVDFYPCCITFVQDCKRYCVRPEDCVAWAGAFEGQLLPGTENSGFIAIPVGIDVTNPFSLYYDGEEKATLGPFRVQFPSGS